MITFLDVLLVRSENIEIPEPLTELPTSFLLYLKNYIQSENSLPYKTERVFVKEKDYVYNIGWDNDPERSAIKTKGDEIIGLESIEDLMVSIKEESHWRNDGFLFIGSTNASHILLRIEKDQQRGKIFFQYRDKNEYEIIAEDIFDFFRNVVLVSGVETFKDLAIDSSYLYKNWGEDFWRVREESV